MDHIFALFVAFVGLTGVLASIAIWAPRRVLIKVKSLLTVALLIPVAYASLADLLGRPKPVAVEWANLRAGEATVLGAQIREGAGIYLWLEMAGLDEPRAYVLPWNRELAQQLQDARRAARKNGNGLKMRRPFAESRTRDEPRFYAPPQPPAPAKQAPTDSAMVYLRPEGAAAR
jgi:hypothetical protein